MYDITHMVIHITHVVIYDLANMVKSCLIRVKHNPTHVVLYNLAHVARYDSTQPMWLGIT